MIKGAIGQATLGEPKEPSTDPNSYPIPKPGDPVSIETWPGGPKLEVAYPGISIENGNTEVFLPFPGKGAIEPSINFTWTFGPGLTGGITLIPFKTPGFRLEGGIGPWRGSIGRMPGGSTESEITVGDPNNGPHAKIGWGPNGRVIGIGLGGKY